MFKSSLIAIGVSLIVTTLSGCNETKSSSSSPRADAQAAITTTDTPIQPAVVDSSQNADAILDTHWSLPASLPSPIGAKPFIQLFKAEENTIRFAGFNGCNRLYGTAIISGLNLTFENISSTKKLCDNPDMKKQEAELFTALKQTRTYTVKEQVLSLLDEHKTTLKVFSAQ